MAQKSKLFRVATEGATTDGRVIQKDWITQMAANFDPTAFPDPMSFDLGRSPNRHVTFGGGGPHLCLGQWMARLEVRAFLEALVERVDHVELAGEPRRVRSNFINGLKALPLTLSRRT